MASKNSTHAKLYRFTYSSNLPHNLCPYFWKLFAAVLLYIPNAIMQVPSRIYMAITKSPGYDCSDHRFLGTILWVFLAACSLVLNTQYHLIKASLDCYSYHVKLANAGLLLDVIALLACICIPIRAKILKKRENEEATEPPPPKEPSIIAEFFKAKYNRYCPKIDWTD